MLDKTFLQRKGFSPIHKSAIFGSQWPDLMVRYYDYIGLAVFACPFTKCAFYVEFGDECALQEFKAGRFKIVFQNGLSSNVKFYPKTDLLTARTDYRRETFKEKFSTCLIRLEKEKIELVF